MEVEASSADICNTLHETNTEPLQSYHNQIFCEDCNVGLERIPDKSVDLIVMDPPYEMETTGGGAFGSESKHHHSELDPISNGISDELLQKIVSKLKKINIYIWCNKNQLHQYMSYFLDPGNQARNGWSEVKMDLLTWHKSNPVPACGNKYLSDTEYCLFFREKGVKVYGSYETKHKYYVTPLNKSDKDQYDHPTVKPLEIIKNLVINSISPEYDHRNPPLVMDPFMGSGTTAVACKELEIDFVGFEMDPKHYATAIKRVEDTRSHTSKTEKPTRPMALDAWGITT